MPTPKVEVGVNQIYTENKIYHTYQTLALLLSYFPSNQKGDISFRIDKLRFFSANTKMHIFSFHHKFIKIQTCNNKNLIISFTFAQYPWLIQCHYNVKIAHTHHENKGWSRWSLGMKLCFRQIH